MLASEERVGQGLRPGVVKGDESGLEDARGGCVPEPPHLPHDLRMRPGLLRYHRYIMPRTRLERYRLALSE